VWVVWEDDNSGTVKYRRGTYQLNTSIVDLEEKEFSIIPNPATTSITIKNHASQVGTIRIFNILGEMVYMKHDVSNNPIDISNFENGLYCIQIIADNKTDVLKLIKQ